MFMTIIKRHDEHCEKGSALPRTRHPTHSRPPTRDTPQCMTRKSELREFLRVRRARLRPEDVGIQINGQRRVPGLRREEIASLAGMSGDYYVPPGQGRGLTPPAPPTPNAAQPPVPPRPPGRAADPGRARRRRERRRWPGADPAGRPATPRRDPDPSARDRPPPPHPRDEPHGPGLAPG